MSTFSSGGVCYPTAATNLLYYWYTNRGAKYKKLLNSTWQKTFDKLYSKSGFIRNLTFKKLFIDNYDLYNNSELGQELLRRMEKMMENIDSIFYYDKVEFAKTVGEEIGFNKGQSIGFSKGKPIGFNNGKNETIKSLIKNNMPEEDIIKFVQISKEELDKIKKSMNK